MNAEKCAYCGLPEPFCVLVDRNAKGRFGYSWDRVCADARACSQRQDRLGQKLLQLEADREASRERRRIA